MITPQTKFFDTVKLAFEDDPFKYCIAASGLIYDEWEIGSIPVKNIIAVPFTGLNDDWENPIYDNDYLRIVEIGRGVKWNKARVIFLNGAWFVEEANDTLWNLLLNHNLDVEIIGSFLTNPEE